MPLIVYGSLTTIAISLGIRIVYSLVGLIPEAETLALREKKNSKKKRKNQKSVIARKKQKHKTKQTQNCNVK